MAKMLPVDILNKDVDEVKAIVMKTEKSDFLRAVANLVLSVFQNLGWIDPTASVSATAFKTILDTFGKTATQRKQLEFVFIIFSRLKELEDRLDKDYMTKAEFEVYVKRIVDQVRHEQYEPKIIGYRNAIINLATRKIDGDFEAEY